MEYSIRELAELAGVSARTLRYYDEISLLKPARTSTAGYRFYGEKQVELLQQILFYRERGMELEQISAILYDKNFDVKVALQEHLLELEKQRRRTEQLILNIKQTIASMEGEIEMSDKERFEAFKQNMVDENEKKYGAEIREKYGNEEVDASNRKMLQMTEEQYERFQNLATEINTRLEAVVREGKSADSEDMKAVVALHKEWILMTWKQYTPEAHKGLAYMYTADERFKKYYDGNVEGCADLLCEAIQYWAE